MQPEILEENFSFLKIIIGTLLFLHIRLNDDDTVPCHAMSHTTANTIKTQLKLLNRILLTEKFSN